MSILFQCVSFVCFCAYEWVFMRMNICVYLRACVGARARARVCVYVYLSVCVFVCMCVCV